jgi:hypothetical protein
MDGDEFADLGSTSTSKPPLDEHETLLNLRPDGLPSPVEVALAQYANSIEKMSAVRGPEVDQYTRGFVAGLRAAIKVAGNVRANKQT